jgi:hypothetical protein
MVSLIQMRIVNCRISVSNMSCLCDVINLPALPCGSLPGGRQASRVNAAVTYALEYKIAA